MTIIFKTDYIKSTLFEDKKYICNDWTGAEFGDEEFKYSMLEVANIASNHTVRGILVDARRFSFTISLGVQEWYDANIVPKHLAAGIKKMAFLLPEDVMAQVSIELTMDEEQAKSQETRYFDTYENAEKWLIS